MDRLDGVGRRELREALLYVRKSGEPVTADDAAVALGIHRGVARDRLEVLLRAGLLSTSFVRRSGRSGPGAGRPAKLYSAAPEPQAIEFPPRRFPALVARLIDELPAKRKRQRALRRAGENFGRDLADAADLQPAEHLAEGLERVCAAVRSLGFQAALDRLDDNAAVISTPTCPLRPLVAERLDAAHIDRGMWAGLVERGVRGARADNVECETSACLEGSEACTVVIRVRRR